MCNDENNHTARIVTIANLRFYFRSEDVTGLTSHMCHLRGYFGSDPEQVVPEPLLSLQIPTEDVYLSPRYATPEVISDLDCRSGTILL